VHQACWSGRSRTDACTTDGREQLAELVSDGSQRTAESAGHYQISVWLPYAPHSWGTCSCIVVSAQLSSQLIIFITSQQSATVLTQIRLSTISASAVPEPASGSERIISGKLTFLVQMRVKKVRTPLPMHEAF
jgi:hypothetical protein